MNPNKYNINDVIYFVHGTSVVKGIVDEFILHYTQKEIIVKYFIRPYGLKDFVQIEEKNIYRSIEKAREVVLAQFKSRMRKEKLEEIYEEAKKQLAEKFEPKIINFESNYKKTVDGVMQLTDKYYNKLEKAFQKHQK